jgi:DedD protein
MIGAAVLVALAVIFVPMLLTGPVDRESMDVPIEIPPRPQVTTVPGLPAPDDFASNEQRRPAATPVVDERPRTPVPAESAATAATATAPTAPPGPAPSAPPVSAELTAWAVQVGRFGSQANALALRDKLRAEGFTAYVEVPDSGGRFFRVRVGPVVERAEADSIKARLEKEQALTGLVVAHP